ncbi:hypothetical protein FKW77_003605 [Venturia effusa]|uniref:SGNH hydrolase-type esterase domain-containing protein n=1 Tax=Venturia effusa TaxID=50376 RepID=A0A517LDK1_9PEZI|nr:hypothetical protein FKW77_003605 [Venturia effusa]
MAKSPNGQIHGWGEHLQGYVNVPVVNKAMGGRSARSFTEEGRFREVAALVTAGDVLIVELGHNDQGSLSSQGEDLGKVPCAGSGNETCKSTVNGRPVIVRTFPAYLIDAGNAFVAKGGKVVFSSMTPNNICESGRCTYTPSRFTYFTKQAAQTVGHGSTFVDHGLYTAKAYQALGAAKVNSFFPFSNKEGGRDHTHTSDPGAMAVANAFVKAVLCANDPNLMPLLKYHSQDGAC